MKKYLTNAGYVLIGLVLCWVIFIDHRPKEYVEIIGSFEMYEVIESGRLGRLRHDRIYIREHPKFFTLERNGKSYSQIEKFFETLSIQTPVSLTIEEGVLSDKEHSHMVYKIIVNDSVIFDRTQENTLISKTINLTL